MRKIINTNAAPRAIGTYSQAVQVENWLYVSGQIPLDPITMHVVEGDFSTQVATVFTNLRAILMQANAGMKDIVKLTIYLINMEQFFIINDVMAKFFVEPYPARAVVAVRALPASVSVEMDVVAYIESRTK